MHHMHQGCTISMGVKDVFQGDLVTLNKLAKFKKGFRYVLIVIDVFSQMFATVPIKRKTPSKIAHAFKVTFKELGILNILE